LRFSLEGFAVVEVLQMDHLMQQNRHQIFRVGFEVERGEPDQPTPWVADTG
jgi:hypothetical protein